MQIATPLIRNHFSFYQFKWQYGLCWALPISKPVISCSSDPTCVLRKIRVRQEDGIFLFEFFLWASSQHFGSKLFACPNVLDLVQLPFQLARLDFNTPVLSLNRQTRAPYSRTAHPAEHPMANYCQFYYSLLIPWSWALSCFTKRTLVKTRDNWTWWNTEHSPAISKQACFHTIVLLLLSSQYPLHQSTCKDDTHNLDF